MKLSAEQTKTFLRIQRRHNVSIAFILRNMPAILKFVQYAITPHLVLKRKVIRKRNRVFIIYNYLRKLIFDPSQLKKRRSVKRIHSQWSKRMVLYLRRYKMVEFFEDEMTAGVKLPEEDVSKQLKEQLELLKSGKRTVPLLEDINTVEQRENILSTRLLSIDEVQHEDADIDEAVMATNDVETKIDIVEDVSKSPPSESTQNEPKNTERLSNGSDRPNGNFLDMLISKVKNTTDDVSEAGAPSERTMKPPKRSVKTIAKEICENDERENSNSSSDFFGFDDNERVPGTFPGMLSTPLVQKRDLNSAFESETLNAYMRDNSLESSAVLNFPQRRPEDGLVYANSVPPKLDMPALPEGLQGLRTVAERRTFLQKTKNVKYCIINNVGTIYRELQKRIKGHRINKHAIEALQTSSSVPLTRQGWKAATWLLTDEGNYFFQTITVDGKNFRLFGCRGNNQNKFKRPHLSRCGKISSICRDDCVDRITFRSLRPIRTMERRSKLSDASRKVVYKACPLSQKILLHSQDDEPVYGSLEIVRMPQVELEVFPQLQKPLNDIAKRYLQLILPYDEITREWAEFSVSTLLERQKIGLDSNPRKSFTFALPYANDRNHVLVRRVYNRCEEFEGQFDNFNLSFRKEIDQKRADGEPLDLLAEECADVLTDMLNSVAISCSENSFIKDDPDNIYQSKNSSDEIMVEKSAKKTVELHQHQTGHQNKKQSRLLMELKRLNATIIDAAASKSEEDGSTCDKDICRLGCVCASLNEGNTVRQHCGKQRCVLECNCRCPSIMRLETDGRTITTEDAFMLRRQATAKLARMEKEFTSTIVLTGSETLLINESQYDKKRRCTKIPKRYGDFVDPDESDLNDNKSGKRIDTPSSVNFPLEPIMVKDKVFQCLRHCTVNVKRLRDIKDLAPWCMIHMVYNCHCKGQSTVGNPIVLEKQEEHNEGTTIDEGSGTKNRTLYSFEKEESAMDEGTSSNYESEYSESDGDSNSSVSRKRMRSRHAHDKRGRTADNDLIEVYMNAKANHCRRAVPIPRNTYLRRNKKRVARIQLYIAEHETDQTRLSLSEHVLRSVYYHKNNQNVNKNTSSTVKSDNKIKIEERKQQSNEMSKKSRQLRSETSITEKSKLCHAERLREDDVPAKKKRRISYVDLEEGTSLLRYNRYRDSKNHETPPTFSIDSTPSPISISPSHTPLPQEQITVPKISQIFSLNAQAMQMGTDTAAAVAADIPQQSTEAAASAEGVTSEAFRNVFQVVIKNMNNLVSKKMQDIDMALRRESKAIPAPNDEILCIIRWNNFLESFMDGFVYLWEVRTVNMTFIAATIRNIMPLVVNALSVVNIRALPKSGLPLLGRMLIDQIKNSITDGLAVVMQGQKMYWFVKGFLRPDKTRICPKPTPETHPLLTKKINILCRLLINQQINEHKKRQETSFQMLPPLNPLQSPVNHSNNAQQKPQISPPRVIQNNVPPKLKVLPMQRNISDHATTILEQMVTQAYGLVRTNITFRKLRQSEIKEIYQPASMSTDHQWLVLDLSNDFSHIFIPELRDLLTLDRIQKVMSYAVTKKRIVKMQFSQKSLFNAYVTPMSRRKLYFGPFRNSINTPKLVLLQSVDGQMMLREVYESRHNVTMKTDKTTAFWLIQKRGKLFLEPEAEMQTTVPHDKDVRDQDDIQEIIDDDVSVITNEVSTVQPAHQIKEARNITIVEKEGIRSLEKTNHANEDDDDCIIIEDEVTTSSAPTSSATPERLNYTISYAGDNSSLVVIQNECEFVKAKDAFRNFTILTSAVEPPLNTPETEQSQFNDSQQNLPQTFQPLNPIENINHQDNQSVKMPSSPTLKTAIEAVYPDTIASVATDTLKTVSTTNLSPAAESSEASLPAMSVAPDAEESNTNEHSAPANETDQNDDNSRTTKGTVNLDSNISKLTAASIKWNKNVTITKVSVDVDNETNPSIPSVAPAKSPQIVSPLVWKSLKAKNSATGKVMLQNQKVRASFPSNALPQLKPIVIGHPTLSPRFQKPPTFRHPSQHLPQTLQKSTSQPVSQQPRQMHPINKPSVPRPVIQKNAPSIINQRHPLNAPRPMTSFQGGLTVRTPTAINTFVTSQQQLIRNSVPSNATGGISLIRPSNPSVRPRAPTSISSPARVPLNTTTGNSQSSPVLKNCPNSVFLRSLTNSKSPNSTQKMQLKKVLPQSLAEVPIRNKIQIKSTITQPLQTCESPQSDPLHISEESSDTIISNLPQPKLPNDVKTVRIASNETQTKVSVMPVLPCTSPDLTVSGFKRNSTGTIVNCPTMRLQPTKKSSPTATSRNNQSTVVTTVSNSSTATNLQVKGIPIELPRLKKFAIISSANTTVITPPKPQLNEKNVEEEGEAVLSKSATENSSNQTQKRKLIASGLVKCSSTSALNTSLSPVINSKNIIQVSTPSTIDTSANLNTDTSNSLNSETEYGYFHANIEGLPKFVVKRVKDDFLIKVPNFNGILKLTGLTTVHNYLNQYTAQKCGKSAEEISDLKWTFRAQDRSKLNSINKSNLSLVKNSSSSSIVQKLLNVKRTISTPNLLANTSPVKTTNNVKIAANVKDNDTKDSIVLLDDD